jgi:hypothetical protein
MACIIGTPAAFTVPKVRANRARATFCTKSPILAGSLSTTLPQPSGKRSRNVRIRLRRSSRVIPKDSLFPAGVIAGVAREKAEAG